MLHLFFVGISQDTTEEYEEYLNGDQDEYDDISNDLADVLNKFDDTQEYGDEEEVPITTLRPSLISIPLVVEETDEGQFGPTGGGDPTLILAGTDEERRPDTLYGGPREGREEDIDIRTSRQTNANSPAHQQGIRPPSSFHQFTIVDPPQKKRQVKAKDLPVTRLLSGRGGQDWSQRLRERQRQRIWRQFNLDRREGRAYFER